MFGFSAANLQQMSVYLIVVMVFIVYSVLRNILVQKGVSKQMENSSKQIKDSQNLTRKAMEQNQSNSDRVVNMLQQIRDRLPPLA